MEKRFTVQPQPIKNEQGLLTGMKFNGGSDDPTRHYTDFEKVKSAINAVQDWYLGVYIVPEPGLHIKTSVGQKGYKPNAAYVGSSYTGLKFNAPESGWITLSIDDGVLIPGSFKNKDHFAAVVRKHNVIELLATAEGFVIHLGPHSRKFWNSAVARMRAGKREGRVMARTSIRTHIIEKDAWKRVDKSKPLPEVLLIKDHKGVELNMFSTLNPGEWVHRVDRNGNPLDPKYWVPSDPNNVRAWESLVKQGVGIVRH